MRSPSRSIIDLDYAIKEARQAPRRLYMDDLWDETADLLKFDLYVTYDTDSRREIHYDDKFEVRFTMPMCKPLDLYPVGDLFHNSM